MTAVATCETAQAVEKVQEHIRLIKSGNYKVKPGQPLRFSEASTPGDCIPQGDLYITLIPNDKVNKIVQKLGYKKVDFTEKGDHCKLVPGTTVGSNHRLESLDGVTMYRPNDWNAETYEGYNGPIIQLAKENTITHSKGENTGHGPVTIPAGFSAICTYQREFDAELKRERRNAD